MQARCHAVKHTPACKGGKRRERFENRPGEWGKAYKLEVSTKSNLLNGNKTLIKCRAARVYWEPALYTDYALISSSPPLPPGAAASIKVGASKWDVLLDGGL